MKLTTIKYTYIYRKSRRPRLPGIENHFLMNVPEVSEQQLSKHDWQDDRGIQRATKIDVETESNRTEPGRDGTGRDENGLFHAILGTYLENGTPKRRTDAYR